MKKQNTNIEDVEFYLETAKFSLNEGDKERFITYLNKARVSLNKIIKKGS